MTGSVTTDGVDEVVGPDVTGADGVEPRGQQDREGERTHATTVGGAEEVLVIGRRATGRFGPVVSCTTIWPSVPSPRGALLNAVIELVDVTVRRGEAVLLNAVDWTVEEDERWVVLGPNGAGKTTLMQLCSAQLHPTTGIVGLLGEVVGTVDVFELRPRIGWTSAAVADRIPAHERVSDVVVSASYGVVGRWREAYDDLDHERARELLTEVGAGHLTDRTFGTLSEGERKRVQIARALMTDPELMLLDEPAAGLDLGGREELVSTLARLAHDELAPATVLVSHHVEEIPPGFTHALVLRQGAVVAAGPLEDVMTEEVLSEAYGLPLTVRSEAGRWTARRRG
jgi:iron complex transport system ATP-binding protein